jgi:hypothetical protein
MSHFTNEFCAAYLRNNRSGGRKNVRCFPSCSPGGHSSSGFCGEKLTLELVKGSSVTMCLAEFLPAETDANTSDFALGTVHTAEDIALLIRSKKKPLARFLEGKLVGDEDSSSLSSPSPVRVFGWKPSCYHYGFRSNKHSTMKQHILRAYALEAIAGSAGSFIVKDIVDTPTFSIFSSKKLDKLQQPQTLPKVAKSTVTKEAKRPDCTGCHCHCQCHGEEMPTPPQDPNGAAKVQVRPRRFSGKRTAGAITEAEAHRAKVASGAIAGKKRKTTPPSIKPKTKKVKMDDDSLLGDFWLDDGFDLLPKEMDFNLDEELDFVIDDFNSTAWSYTSGSLPLCVF